VLARIVVDLPSGRIHGRVVNGLDLNSRLLHLGQDALSSLHIRLLEGGVGLDQEFKNVAGV
jgi:hypothetical protein